MKLNIPYTLPLIVVKLKSDVLPVDINNMMKGGEILDVYCTNGEVYGVLADVTITHTKAVKQK